MFFVVLGKIVEMKVNAPVINALLAALYIAVTRLIASFGFTHIQFRSPRRLAISWHLTKNTFSEFS